MRDKSLFNLQDLAEDTAEKIAFLSIAIGDALRSEDQLGEEARAGLESILDGIKDDMDWICDGICEFRKTHYNVREEALE